MQPSANYPVYKRNTLINMKRLLTLMIPLMLLMAACEKSQYLPNRTIVTDVRSGNWINNGNGTNYSAAIDLPELDNYLQDRGGILVYASFDDRVTYEQVPQVYDGIAYSYVARRGQVRIDIQGSNGTEHIIPPSFMTVKIVLIDSDY